VAGGLAAEFLGLEGSPRKMSMGEPIDGLRGIAFAVVEQFVGGGSLEGMLDPRVELVEGAEDVLSR
jgi:hypothetical protein